MTTTTIHHPSCPARCLEPSNCPDEATGMPCNNCWSGSCLCGPEAQAEDKLILMERNSDAMLLDIVSAANGAQADWLQNAHGRRTPKGLLSCVLLDNAMDTDQPMARSWGAK